MSTTPTLRLGRDGMGVDNDGTGFEEWITFVMSEIDERYGFAVDVEIAQDGDVQEDRIFHATDDEREVIKDAKRVLWDDFCANGGT